MKAWQLTTGLVVLAIAAGWLRQVVERDQAQRVRAQLDHAVGRAYYDSVSRPREAVSRNLRLSAIAARIRDSQSVRSCFFETSKTLGYVEDVHVRLHVTESDRFDDVLVMEPDMRQNTDVDACLERALRLDLTIPPYEGASPAWMTYVFDF